jgi:hypothetical protein
MEIAQKGGLGNGLAYSRKDPGGDLEMHWLDESECRRIRQFRHMQENTNHTVEVLSYQTTLSQYSINL